MITEERKALKKTKVIKRAKKKKYRRLRFSGLSCITDI